MGGRREWFVFIIGIHWWNWRRRRGGATTVEFANVIQKSSGYCNLSTICTPSTNTLTYSGYNFFAYQGMVGTNGQNGNDSDAYAASGGNGGNGAQIGTFSGYNDTSAVPMHLLYFGGGGGGGGGLCWTCTPSSVGTTGNPGKSESPSISGNEKTNGYMPMTFSDGLSANIALSGDGYNLDNQNDKYYAESGNISSLLIYFNYIST